MPKAPSASLPVETGYSRKEAEAVVERCARLVYRVALTRTRQHDLAEDVMQEVFLRYVRKKPVFESDEHERAWFVRVTVNRANSMLTARAGRHVSLEAFWEAGERGRSVPGAYRPDSPLFCSGVTLPDDESRELFAAVMALPPFLRTVVYLHYYEGYKVAEMAAMLRRSQSACKSALMRARKALKGQLTVDR